MKEPRMYKSEFIKELTSTINKHSVDDACDTPDFILAELISEFLADFQYANYSREKWFGRGAIPVPLEPK